MTPPVAFYPRRPSLVFALLLFFVPLSASLAATGRMIHVSTTGDDSADGSVGKPLRTLARANALVQSGETVRVHAGTYREAVRPQRGGTSNDQRIVWEAAPGEEVWIKGSERVSGWEPLGGGVWRVRLPAKLFGAFNPFRERIAGDWFDGRGRAHHLADVYLDGRSLFEVTSIDAVRQPPAPGEASDPEAAKWTWFSEADGDDTVLYSNFHDKDPNTALVEVNVRDTCFYPSVPGCDFITVRGFHLSQAATQWAAPTAEQPGLVGTHWSRGWIIEDNVISNSRCTGITLGKDRATGHNVWSKDPSKDGAIHYEEVIARALAAGWSKGKIGSHIVRRNVITDCEQAGICGSLGAVFSEITDNHISRTWYKRQFGGAEMAGIKLHAAIDTVIAGNRVHANGRGIWLDWMAQGTRVSRNVLYDNSDEDLFVEVNHGPFVVDSNVMVSENSVHDLSEGGAWVHNLFGGRFVVRAELTRSTPFHRPHSTELAGRAPIHGGDHRFLHNIFVGRTGPFAPLSQWDRADPKLRVSLGLEAYDGSEWPIVAKGNVFLSGALPSRDEKTSTGASGRAVFLKLTGDDSRLELAVYGDWPKPNPAKSPETDDDLGVARATQLPYEDALGKPVDFARAIDGDRVRSTDAPPGPFATWPVFGRTICVWKKR